jgi:hypothetical protein
VREPVQPLVLARELLVADLLLDLVERADAAQRLGGEL